MYKVIIRPLLFLIPPETIHNFVNTALKIIFSIPGSRAVAGSIFKVKRKELVRNVAGLEFRNPVGLAAGFDKNGLLYNELSSFGFAFIEVGTVTPKPQPGNKRPRSFRLVKDKALINRMGFNNVGVDKVIERLRRKGNKVIIGGNVGKNSVTANKDAVNDYETCFEKLYNYVDYFVVNVSCPNISNLTELQDIDNLGEILERLVRIRKGKEVYKPVLLKISPDLDNNKLDDIIKICEKMDINGIVCTNTTIEREGLRTHPGKIERIGSGGLSGKPIKDRSTQIIRYINEKTDGRMPIIGVGGIMSPEDAIEKIEAGATLVQIYTGFIYEGPFLVKRINKEILKRFS
ncbi:MAG: quinone-dependent dihydroorotate dehydrogenase [Bacteroidales bacterium]|nr:MAG: quinone-dependent dihydroorotate dehydrogenase [Bacteroidales bacterium]